MINNKMSLIHMDIFELQNVIPIQLCSRTVSLIDKSSESGLLEWSTGLDYRSAMLTN